MSTLNKRCACGSGKKFKNCCAVKDQQPTHREFIKEKLDNASTFYAAGKLDNAGQLYEQVLEHSPREKAALFGLSLVLTYQRDYPRAEIVLKKLIELESKNPVYYSNLGFVLHEDKRPNEAIAVLNKGIALNPEQTDAYFNRANSYTVQGKIDAAIADYRTVLRIDPKNTRARANMVYCMNFSPSISEAEIFDAHRVHAHSIQSGATQRHDNNPDTTRKLKIAYISAEFRQHSVSYFIAPVLEHHNKDQFEIYAYYNHDINDDVTDHLKQVCDHWYNIGKLPDQAVVEKIRQDGIDILIDLNGYTAGNRLAVLACKPAPVQCEWLGYPNTTGLDAMDYWICDTQTNPPGLTEASYSESLLRLANCFISFKPPIHAAVTTHAPYTTNQYITFGSFNNYAKVSESVLSLWAEILNNVPDSHLLLKSACLGNPVQRQVVYDYFAARHIAADRLQLEGHEPSRDGHLEKYADMDIALDTFPYNGTTTTCEALWMGVPVISLAGDSHRSRVGKTLLENADLSELIANDRDQYLKHAVELANQPERIQHYRTTLRQTLADSKVTNSRQFTASLETAYRTIWNTWCNDQAH